MKLPIFGGELSPQNMVRVKGVEYESLQEDLWMWPLKKHS